MTETPSCAHNAHRRDLSCRSCGASVSQSFADLGMTPLCESFVPAEALEAMEPFYPLHARVCGRCLLVQLPAFASREEIFSEYAYFSSYSTSWVAHAKAYCDMITKRLGLRADSFVVELASNDGYLLQHFSAHGVPALGIEPAANVAEAARDKGVATRVAFFGEELGHEMARDGQSADLIIGNNVLAQVPELNDFVAGMRALLKPEGIITLEFPHLERLMADNQFDTIYHEHFCYFSLLSVHALMTRHALKLVDVEELPTHGGSLRVYLAHEGARLDPSPQVGALLDRERAGGFAELATYQGFDAQVRRTKRDLLRFLIRAKDEGLRICGYGAPGKGNTLLNYCGIGPDFLDFTVDRNPYKHGRFTPGMRVPILPVEAIDEARPDLILILPWNLKDEIMQQMAHVRDWGARFIVPIPRVSLIDPPERAPAGADMDKASAGADMDKASAGADMDKASAGADMDKASGHKVMS